MIGNIVGEPFKKYVNDQIRTRQEVHGSGFDGSLREQQHLNYLNSRLAWVKMASSVLVNPPRPGGDVDGDKINSKQKIATGTSGNEGLDRLSSLGFENPETFLGYKLASSAILFNGLQQAKFDSKNNTDDEGKVESVDPTIADKFSKWQTRMGYAKDKSIWNNSSYGLGGIDFGLQPMPGITGVEINHINRGSIKKATITLKAYNKVQFEIIDLLYLRLGFNMLLEWGNSHYIESNEINENGDVNGDGVGDISTVGPTLTEQFWFNSEASNTTPLLISKKFEEYRFRYDGNYDGMMGRVSNFNWTFNPDGSYDITIQLTSLGDVVESFKVNTLPNPDNNLSVDQANKDQISLLLYNKRQSFKLFGNQGKDVTNYIDIKEPSLKDKTKSLLGFENDDEKYRYYIRFGELLLFIQNSILTNFFNGSGNSFPIIGINNSTIGNVMSIFPNQISLDPRICIINTKYFDPPLDSDIPVLNKLQDFSSQNPVPHGRLMNVYLNFDFIERILKEKVDTKGNLSLFSFIQAICDGINKSLGNLNNLEPIVNEETNILTIIDQTPFEGKDKLREFIKSEYKNTSQSTSVTTNNGDLTETTTIPGLNTNNNTESTTSTPFNVYGYNSSSNKKPISNFIKSFSFTTEIGPNLANTIAIGATANGTVVGEDATSFSQWNRGLTDKFKTSIADPLPPPLSKKPALTSNPTESTSILSAITTTIFSNPFRYFGLTSPNKAPSEEYTKKKSLALVNEYRQYYLPTILGKSLKNSDQITVGDRNFTIPNTGKYFNFEDDTIQRGFTSFKNYFSKVQSSKDSKYTTGTLGFLPINLQLELDGLSGIKLYQKLKVDSSFLPSNYPDVLEFLVKQVNHEIKDNKWVTRIETISIPKTQIIPIIDRTSSNTKNEEILAPEDLEFYSPINEENLSTFVRNDKEGKGTFNSPRGEDEDKNKKYHKGVDILTTETQQNPLGTEAGFTRGKQTQIYAPIDGTIYITKAKTKSKTSGIRIVGTGEFTGYTAWVFYIKPIITSGESIKKGAPIGIPQDLSLDYSEGVKDHIHFQIQVLKGGKEFWIDPLKLKYSSKISPGFEGTDEEFFQKALKSIEESNKQNAENKKNNSLNIPGINTNRTF